jgi:TonB-dependent starch-binding outer membrane protein SusC
VLNGKGVDFSLATNNLKGSLKWNTNFFFSYNTNKVAKYLLDFTAKDYLNSEITPLVGKSAYSVISRRWGGLDPANGDPRGYYNGQLTKDYALINSSVNADDYVIHGPSQPTVFGALCNAFAWKRFNISANITYRLGYYFRRPNTINYTSLFGFWAQTGYADYAIRWQKPGDEANTDVPSMVYPGNGSRDNMYVQSEATVEKADHIRLQDIRFSYDIPKLRIGKLSLNSLGIYAYVNNIGMIWKATSYKLDPEYGTPLPKSYSLGFKLEF